MEVDAEVRLPLGRTQPQAGEPTSLNFEMGDATDDDGDETENAAGEAGGGMDTN